MQFSTIEIRASELCWVLAIMFLLLPTPIKYIWKRYLENKGVIKWKKKPLQLKIINI